MATFDDITLASYETDVLWGRLPMPDSQVNVATLPGTLRSDDTTCGWYGSAVNAERGAFGMVLAGGEQEDLVGERVRITAPDGHQVAVYILGRTDKLDSDLAVCRRAFMEIGLLADGSLPVTVEVLL